MGKIYSTILAFIFAPLRIVDSLIPKNEKIWIFGSSNGLGYSDNSKALFEYVSKNKENIRAIWLTKQIKTKQEINSKGYESYLFYSRKGVYFGLIAKVLVISTSFLDLNLPAYGLPKNKKIIQLWHGTPLKKLGRFQFSLLKSLLLRLFLNYLGRDCDLVISTTPLNRTIYAEQFNIDEHNIKLTGQPRNDALINQTKLRGQSKEKIFLYLPTWREYDSNFDFFIKYNFDPKKINSFLHKNNSRLIIKFHHVDREKNQIFHDLFKTTSNISLSKIQDIHPFLPNVAVLLTDYSSVFFDFLLLNRPIVFTCFDLDEYTAKRNFYYNYESVTPGPKARNWDDVLMYLQDIVNGVDRYEIRREKIRRMFNEFSDSNNSQRVYETIIESLE